MIAPFGDGQSPWAPDRATTGLPNLVGVSMQVALVGLQDAGSAAVGHDWPLLDVRRTRPGALHAAVIIGTRSCVGGRPGPTPDLTGTIARTAASARPKILAECLVALGFCMEATAPVGRCGVLPAHRLRAGFARVYVPTERSAMSQAACGATGLCPWR